MAQDDVDLVSVNGFLLKDISNPSDEVILKAISNCPEAIRFLNHEHLSGDLVRQLLAIDSTYVVDFPVTYMTRKRLLRAVQKDPSVVERFNDDHYGFVTAKDLLRVTRRVWPYLRPDDITEDLCKYAATRYPQLYRNIPELFKTKDVNRELVQRNMQLISQIPEAHFNRKLVQRLLEIYPDCHYLLPEKWKHDYISELI